MSDNKCKWKSGYYNSDYECHERAMGLDSKGYCILHSCLENKGTDIFIEKVKERLSTAEAEIDLKGCYFPKDFPRDYFRGRTFDKPVDLSEATFSQVADFYYAKLKEASFSGATFSQANFSQATFSQRAHFSGAKFSEASFSWAKFSKGVDFLWTTFSQVDFSGATFSQADFSWAEFKERALLSMVILGPSNFYRTRFLGEVVFEDVDLSECSFLNSNIDKVDFRNCKFVEERGRKNVLRDERDCDDKVGTALVAVREQTGASPVPTEKKAREGYEPVHRLYLELKKNFEDKKDWNTAGDFHYGEMESRRKMKDGWLRRNILSLEALYYWASGYGERPLRALACIIGLIPFCMFFYWLFDFATGHSINLPTTDSVNAVPTTASQVNQPSHGLGYWFWYSLKAAFLWRFGETGAEPSSVFGKGVLFLESVLGPLLIALFILALRRKVKR